VTGLLQEQDAVVIGYRELRAAMRRAN
jgi:hypothetical protein